MVNIELADAFPLPLLFSCIFVLIYKAAQTDIKSRRGYHIRKYFVPAVK